MRSYLKKYFLSATALCFLFLAYGCGGDKDGDTSDDANISADSMAVKYYQMRACGDFDSYIKAMQSCEGTTEAYKKSITQMLKHHNLQTVKEKQGIQQVQFIRTELADSGKAARVFLKVSYKDQSDEEVMMPLVKVGDTWKLQ